jgi:hypothetical protein
MNTEQLSSKTCAQLKDILRERGEKLTGRKSELIQRIIDTEPQYDMQKLVENGILVPIEPKAKVLKPLSVSGSGETNYTLSKIMNYLQYQLDFKVDQNGIVSATITEKSHITRKWNVVNDRKVSSDHASIQVLADFLSGGCDLYPFALSQCKIPSYTIIQGKKSITTKAIYQHYKYFNLTYVDDWVDEKTPLQKVSEQDIKKIQKIIKIQKLFLKLNFQQPVELYENTELYEVKHVVKHVFKNFNQFYNAATMSFSDKKIGKFGISCKIITQDVIYPSRQEVSLLENTNQYAQVYIDNLSAIEGAQRQDYLKNKAFYDSMPKYY